MMYAHIFLRSKHVGLEVARPRVRRVNNYSVGSSGCGVLNHEASHVLALKVCQVRGVSPTPSEVWARLELDDILAAALARLLYFTDPKPLPSVDDADGAWALYLRTWRPGKSKPDTWPAFHARARAFVLGAP